MAAANCNATTIRLKYHGGAKGDANPLGVCALTVLDQLLALLLLKVPLLHVLQLSCNTLNLEFILGYLRLQPS